MHYIFIDYENLQPSHLTPLMDVPCEIYIFIDALQNKLPVKLVTQMQKLGRRARFIQISESAKDALDFHIAYYVGEVAAADKDGHFHIISNDKGYDPLIEHLTGKSIKIQRKSIRIKNPVAEKTKERDAKVELKSAEIGPKPKPKSSNSTAQKLNTQQKISKIRKCLKHTQPATEKKLRNFIKNQLPASKDKEIENLINNLRNKKIVAGQNNEISYPAFAS